MTRGARNAVMLWTGLVMALVLTGCGGGGKKGSPSGPSADAPVVSNLRINAETPERAGRRVEWVVLATVTDPDNDLVGGRAEARVVSTGRVIAKTIEADDLRGDRFGALLVFENPDAGRIDLVFSVVDAAGHRSNEVPFFVTVAAAQLPRGTRPGAFRGSLQSAR